MFTSQVSVWYFYLCFFTDYLYNLHENLKNVRFSRVMLVSYNT